MNFFHDLQVNVLLTKIFLVLESLVNYRNYPNLVRTEKLLFLRLRTIIRVHHSSIESLKVVCTRPT